MEHPYSGERRELSYTPMVESLLALEPRFMYDAAGLVTGAEVSADTTAQAQTDDALDNEHSQALPAAAPRQDQEPLIQALLGVEATQLKHEIVFVDSRLSGQEALLSGINPSATVVMLDASRDGIEQIAEVLSGREGIDAVHILSHGGAGVLQLGSGSLTAESMRSGHAEQLETIGEALGTAADILIYGCNFGEGAAGQQAVALLSAVTGADVAASVDITGAAELGGDWDLELRQGDIDTELAFSDQAQDHWLGSLDVASTPGPVAGSYTLAADGEITVTISAADGGLGSTTVGGSGASVNAVFSVRAGDVVDYVVGSVGGADTDGFGTGGGGGSTGVYINNELVMVAGAGAGGDNSAGAVGLGGNDADLGTAGDDGAGVNFGSAGTGGNGGGGTSPAGGGGGGGGTLSAGGNSNGGGGAVSSAGISITGLETATLVSGGAGQLNEGGDGGQGFTGGGGGGLYYAGAGAGYSGGGASGDQGSAGGGGSFLDTGFDDGSASFVSGSSTPGTDGGSADANGSIEIVFSAVAVAGGAVDDANVTDEATVIPTVAAPGVLANDDLFIPGSQTAGATASYLAQTDNDGDALWEDQIGALDWTFAAATNASAASSNFLFTESFVFPVAAAGASGASFDAFSGNSSDSFEFWLKFDESMTGTGSSYLVFETGDSFGGFALTYNDSSGDMEFHYDDDNVGLSVFSISADLASNGISATDEFFQLVVALDDTNERVDLYLNGALAASGVGAGVTIDDYSSDDASGLGSIVGDATGAADSVVAAAASALPYSGEMGAVLFYNDTVLSASDVDDNYFFITDHIVVTAVESAVTAATSITELAPGDSFQAGVHDATILTPKGGLVTLSYDGSYTYDPNGAFAALTTGETAVDSFSYSVASFSGSVDTAEVLISITGIAGGRLTVADAFNSNSVNEDAGPTALTGTLLDNDSDDSGTITAGASLNWDASADMDALDNDGGSAGDDWLDSTGSGAWELDANVGLDPASESAHPRISAAYTFDGSGASGAVFDFGMTGSQDSFSNITGDPTAADASFELWFRDDGNTASGDQILFETGGGVDGTSLRYHDATNTLHYYALDSGTLVNYQYNLDSTGIDASADFIQIIGTYDRDSPGTTDSINLYVNGVATGAAITSDTLNDWSGGDDAGLGRLDGGINVAGGVPFAGDIAIMRFYEFALSATQVHNNYDVVLGNIQAEVTSIDSATSSPANVPSGATATITTDLGASVTVGSDGAISYDPNAQFGSLNFGDSVQDSFSYTVANNAGAFDTSTVAITVHGNNSWEVSSLRTAEGGDGSDGVIFQGVAAGDELGFSVASAGDVNGDGIDDVVMGALTADPNGRSSGQTFVVFGSSAGFSAEFDLSTLDGSNGFVLNGIDRADYSGRSVAAGDVNGDGFSDLIISALRADPNGNWTAGETYVVFGQTSFSASFELSTLAAGDGSTGFVLNGVATGDISGRSVAYAGDINGDGIGDIAVSAPWADPNGSHSGATYLIYGRSDFTPILVNGEFELSTLAGGGGANGSVFNGGAAQDYSGSWVAGAGDVDGDGLDDLVIGAFGASPGGRTYAGAAYVVLGNSSGFGGSFELSTLAAGGGASGFAIHGAAAGDYAGVHVASSGDINGDGIADIVVSASYADPYGAESGATYVVYGDAGGFAGTIELSLLTGSSGLVINGAAAGDYSGRSAQFAGDVNGDGFDDLVIGRESSAADSTGESYLIFGSDSLPATIALSTIIPAGGPTIPTGFLVPGIDSADYSGVAVSAAGDINGDGFDDLIVGAYFADGNGQDSGEAYVLFGRDFRAEQSVVGDDGDNVLIGSVSDEVLFGGKGNDTLNGAGGNDVQYGGPGDDTLVFDGADTLRIDGGTGNDTLALSGGGNTLDLTAISNLRLQNIEIIDITGSGNNTLSLTALDLFDLSGSSDVLRIDGNAGDSVATRGGFVFDQVVNIAGSNYNQYLDGEAVLQIQDAIDDTGVALVYPASDPASAEQGPLREQGVPLEEGGRPMPGLPTFSSQIAGLALQQETDIDELLAAFAV